MTDKTISFDEIRNDYFDFINSCGKFNFFTRTKRIQSEKVVECEHYLQVIKSYKKQVIDKGVEALANELFHMQCMVNASRSSLLMWIALKEEKFNDAWSALVDAQEYISIALKIKDYEGVRNLEKRLQAAEESIFPGWSLYNSPGFVETIGNCSICGELFSLCDHVENQIYMGQLCQRIDRNIVRTDHFAFVQNPRDRRCIITKISEDDGQEIDYFTWEKTGEKKDNSDGMHAEAIMFKIPTLDVS